MFPPILLSAAPLLSIQFSSKIVSTKLTGAAIGYSAYEKLAEIINVKFPRIFTTHLPYLGLISGVFAGPQTLVIYAIALLILIPIQRYQTAKKTVCPKPAFIEEMGKELNNTHYCPRMKEINKIRNILNKCEKRNVLIIGNPGSGKTSLIKTIAQMKRDKDPNLHPFFVNKKFFKVSCAKIMSNTGLRGQLEEKIVELVMFAKENKNAVFVFDEIHQMAMANISVEGGLSVLEFMKESLPDGEISIIGMTTEEEFHRYIAINKAMVRRFTEIYLEEPTIEESLNMLQERANIFRDKYPDIECPDTIYDYIFSLIKPSRETSLIDQAFDLLDTAYSEASCKSKRAITREIIEEINKGITRFRVDASLYRGSY